MIQQASLSVESQWQKELKQSYSRPSDLLDALSLSDHFDEQDYNARSLFAMRVPRHFAKLMKPGDPRDPLLLQVLPTRNEFKDVDGYSIDPLQEHDAKRPGLLHKYKSRVLIMFKTGCAVNCRYCFRRHFPYEDNAVNKKQLLEHIEYLQSNTDINEVILSGGDPLMAKDDAIKWFIEQIQDIHTIKRLRIHTRLPVVIPSRITDTLTKALQNTRLKTIVVLHINHANEVSSELKAGVAKLAKSGVTMLNQAVLMKGINDSSEAQVSLSERLFDAGILPYYLHVFDKVKGAAHFDISDLDVKQLYQQMLLELPGFLMPKLVKEIGGEASKTPIHPF